jgi:hypothetical protein
MEVFMGIDAPNSVKSILLSFVIFYADSQDLAGTTAVFRINYCDVGVTPTQGQQLCWIWDGKCSPLAYSGHQAKGNS